MYIFNRKPDDYSIGGCPLECPFDLNEDFDEALFIDIIPTVFKPLNIPVKFAPLAINPGRMALRQAIVQHEPFVKEMNLVKESPGWPDKDCPVFSLVDCSDQDKPLVLTGFKNDDAGINVHLMGRFRPDAEILDMKTFKGYHDMNVFTFDVSFKLLFPLQFRKFLIFCVDSYILNFMTFLESSIYQCCSCSV